MSNDIYRILQRFDSVAEGLSPEQEKVKQLPALFKPKDTSPQLSGPYPGRNATLGYLVGEGEEDTNPMRRAVTHRIVNQHPEWIMKYGVEALMQAIDDVTEGEDDFEEIGSSDVSAYVRYVKDRLDDHMGSKEEMDDRKPFAEGVSVVDQDYDLDQIILTMDINGRRVQFTYTDYDEDFENAQRKDVHDQLQRKDWYTNLSHPDRMEILDAAYRAIRGLEPQEYKPTVGDEPMDVGDRLDEGATTEDVISTVKKKLGDYLSDLSKEIKKDPDLKDKLEKDIDQIGPAVKTLKTDDGHEIKIHGNEDDGFRITIKNKQAKTKFENLDEAVMACEMYCARRRGAPAVNNTDYIEEA